ncbi:MAG: hypothetical protein PHG00_17450 [Methylococcales bacterium]|nr:hypothetical protein [Methylococcales bacterium]
MTTALGNAVQGCLRHRALTWPRTGQRISAVHAPSRPVRCKVQADVGFWDVHGQRHQVQTFTARLSDYRNLPVVDSGALVSVQVEPAESVSVATPAVAVIVFTHVHGHRLELSPTVSAGWVAELLRCLA